MHSSGHGETRAAPGACSPRRVVSRRLGCAGMAPGPAVPTGRGRASAARHGPRGGRQLPRWSARSGVDVRRGSLAAGGILGVPQRAAVPSAEGLYAAALRRVDTLNRAADSCLPTRPRGRIPTGAERCAASRLLAHVARHSILASLHTSSSASLACTSPPLVPQERRSHGPP